MLKEAVLIYGRSEYPISSINKLPKQFDFENPESCARKIFEEMSSNSGNFALRNCVVRYDAVGGFAALVGSGVRVSYVPDGFDSFTEPSAALDSIRRSIRIELGDICAL